MLLSIIIPTYNTVKLTLRCVERVLLYPPAGPYEIIVVDNRSSDGTSTRIEERFSEVVVIRNSTNAGFSRACNRGASVAKGEFLLFLNSDCEPLPETFNVLIRWLRDHERTAIVGPRLIGGGGELIQMSWGWNPLYLGELIQQYFAPYALRRSPFKQRVVRFLQRKSKHVPLICGASLMIRKTIFDEIKGFDEEFELYFEDSDLCLRSRKAGWYVDFVSESELVHHLGQSSWGRSWNTTSLIYQQSHITYYKKHGFLSMLWVLKVYLLLKWLRLCMIAYLEDEDKERSSAYVRTYFRMILGKEKVTLDKGIPRLSVVPAGTSKFSR